MGSPKFIEDKLIQPRKTATTSFPGRARMAPATLLEWLELGETADELMPAPDSIRGYRHGTVFETFMLMSHEGSKCLEDMLHLHEEAGTTRLTGFRPLPCAATPGNWLYRVGRR
ncbi:MAG: hypothetical protein OXF20_05375 [Gammaproteobacteria bacterium]|nr:hypothetical protein [Gammaproteobacteria bacterium]